MPLKPPAGEKIIDHPRRRSTSPTIPSFPTSRATAPGATSGAPRSASSTPRWRRPSAASARSPGSRCWPARRPSTRRRSGCRRRRSTPSASTWSASRARSRTPVGGGIRSLNVALRQELDLYVCLRPVRYFKGVPSPVKRPEDVDMVIFRENTEDIYAGVEWAAGTPEVQKVIAVAADGDEGQEDPLPGDERDRHQAHLAARARSAWCARPSSYALEHKRKSLTLVHKGNIMKFTEGAFRDWGYALATREFRDEVVTERESWILGNKEKDAGAQRRGQRPRHRARLRPHDRRPEGQGAPGGRERRSPSCPRTATASGSRSSWSATPSPTSRCSRC